MNALSKNMRALRAARGWSLGDLAKRMDGIVTRQALQKYETEEITPSPSVLKAMAGAFKIEPLKLATAPDGTLEILAFRKRKRLSAEKTKAIMEDFAVKAQRRFEIQDCCRPFVADEASLNLPDCSKLSPEEAACKVRRFLKLGEAPIADLTNTLEDFGMHIIALDQLADFDGICGRRNMADGSNQYVLGVAKSKNGGRFRMTLAHELGHLAMQSEEEDKANAFAGALLAPAKIMRNRLGHRRNKIKKTEIELIAEELKISHEAVVFRAHELEIINKESYRFWMRQLRRKGVKKEDNLLIEQSEWELHCILQALAEGVIGDQQVRKWLGPEMAAKLLESDEPDTQWELRKKSQAERAKLLNQALPDAVKIYNDDAFEMVAEAGEVYDDSAQP